MAVEGFDAALPIETAGFVPQAGIGEAPEADAAPTLDAALRDASPDLWVEVPAAPIGRTPMPLTPTALPACSPAAQTIP